MQTMLPKITDYWNFSSTTRAIDGLATGLESLSPDQRRAVLTEFGAAVQEHVRVLPDKSLATAAVAVADDLYKAACWIDRWDDDLGAYLEATAEVFWSSFSERGLTLRYLVDNVFDELSRPTALFPEWFRSCGIVYVCPQVIAAELIQATEGDEASIGHRMPSYIGEARDVAAAVLDRCRIESRHLCLLDLDYDERTFRSSLAEAGGDGVLTVFRNQAAEPGTKVSAWLPAGLS